MKTKCKIILIGLLFTFSSCSEASNESEITTESNSENTAETNAKGTEKLNLLVDAFNSFSTLSYKSYNNYAKAFGEDPEKFEIIRDWYSGENIRSYTTDKVNELDKAIEIKAYKELNPMILAYKENALALIEELNKSYTYFDMKDYESDNFAKAKEFHKPTLLAYNNFFAVDNQLRIMSDSIQHDLEIIRLNKLKEEGETLNYLIGMSLNTSAAVLKTTQANEYENLNTEELEKVHNNARKILDELTQFQTDKPEEFNTNTRLSYFYKGFKDFIKASRELVNRKKENKPFSRGEKMNLNPSSGWMVRGSTYKVLKKYNELINRYNSMIN